ncbi:MAG: hypothetical protein ACK53L_00505, partial [Pirellulaceae bacterium]
MTPLDILAQYEPGIRESILQDSMVITAASLVSGQGIVGRSPDNQRILFTVPSDPAQTSSVISFTIQDSGANTITGQAVVNFATATLPLAMPDFATTSEESPVTINPLSNDVFGNSSATPKKIVSFT